MPHAQFLAGGALATAAVRHMTSTCTIRILHESKQISSDTHNVLQVNCVVVVHHGEPPRESQGVHATSLAGQAALLGTVCALLLLTILHSYSRRQSLKSATAVQAENGSKLAQSADVHVTSQRTVSWSLQQCTGSQV
jgi:hypothetical protein